MNDDRQIEWEPCPIPSGRQHTQYRGFDVHQWASFLCFYPTEGEATKDELGRLLERIKEAGLEPLTWKSSIYYSVRVRQHEWRHHTGETCSIRERLDEQLVNFCLETPNLDSLDAIIDGLWEQSGLTKRVPIKEGRVF